ncbi:citramalate synthase [candidate division MSBL1 archaeon SCGC-AAA259I09]|uniref:Citramalate synthase n=2 Tax=candidate division MSBL1 TaxID=215777 RepID=A0A133UTY4_9EURY|nr:citramalate synthase [candidate division MSBL1 archaeon SCGC-AAA259I09]KXA98866.1 citramalate synthase [candidate division MSBL1 archaeon SCGC-AAA259J03]
MTKRKIKVLDTTLRDGEQTPGVALAPDEKLKIARELDDLGVDIIEAGSAITSAGEREGIKKIVDENLNAEIISFARITKSDIEPALDCGVDAVHLVFPSSDLHIEKKIGKTREDVKDIVAEISRYALDNGLTVELSAEDATRADRGFLKEVFQIGLEEGVQRICICDTVSMMMPEQIYDLFSEFAEIIDVPIAAHCHDDFGVGVANTISALRAGGSEIHATINGLGERAGNSALEEIALAISEFYDDDFETDLKLEKLYEVSKVVEEYTGIPISPTKAVIGANAFAHEAGIHTHGVLSEAKTYEPVAPEKVGQKRRLIFGKHTGKHAIENEIERIGLDASDSQIDKIFKRIKDLGDRGKLVTDAEWTAIIDDVMGRSLEEVVTLEELTVTGGDTVTPTAAVKIKYEDREFIEAGVGVGPVDAAINAIRKVVSGISNISLQEYHVDAISGGTDAMVDVVVKLTDGKRIIDARGSSEDIIKASVQAMLNGVNRLLWDKKLSEGEK